MVNPFYIAKKLWKDINDLSPENRTDDIVEAIIVKTLVEMHGHGYNNAKMFYIDKPAGWGKEVKYDPED